jgi:hypothetical protein
VFLRDKILLFFKSDTEMFFMSDTEIFFMSDTEMFFISDTEMFFISDTEMSCAMKPHRAVQVIVYDSLLHFTTARLKQNSGPD